MSKKRLGRGLDSLLSATKPGPQVPVADAVPKEVPKEVREPAPQDQGFHAPDGRPER